MRDATQAILWDNDGILVDTEHIYFDVTRTVLAEIGVMLDADMYRDLFLKSSSGAWHLAEELGFDENEVASLRDRRNALYAEALRSADVVIDGVAEVLDSLYGQFRMAVVTSSRRLPFSVVHERSGLLHYFELVLAREDYTRSKPDPEPYLTAAERLEVPAENCLVIEDSQRGLEAAVAAGMPCWIIPNGLSSRGDFRAAERVLSSVRDVPRLLGV